MKWHSIRQQTVREVCCHKHGVSGASPCPGTAALGGSPSTRGAPGGCWRIQTLNPSETGVTGKADPRSSSGGVRDYLPTGLYCPCPAGFNFSMEDGGM